MLSPTQSTLETNEQLPNGRELRQENSKRRQVQQHCTDRHSNTCKDLTIKVRVKKIIETNLLGLSRDEENYV